MRFQDEPAGTEFAGVNSVGSTSNMNTKMYQLVLQTGWPALCLPHATSNLGCVH